MTGVAYQLEIKSHISYCVTPKSHIIHMGTREHHLIFPHTHTYLCSAWYIVYITQQHDKDRTLQAIYCYACCLMGLLVIT